MNQLYRLLLISCIICLTLSQNKTENEIIKLEYGKSTSVTMAPETSPKSKYIQVEFSPELTKARRLANLFRQISIEVNGTTSSGAPYVFPFHSVSGKSTDDGHEILKYLFLKAFFPSQLDSHAELTTISSVSSKSNFIRDFIRDIFSSCPSPLFGNRYRSLCTMTYSPFGIATVRIKSSTKDNPKIHLTGTVKFNPAFVVNLILGMLFLLLAHYLSKSKIFQYLIGAFSCIFVGVLLIVLYTTGAVSAKHRVVENTSLFAFLTGTYGATFIWFLRTYLNQLLIELWELVAAYTVVMTFIGLLIVRFVRSYEGTSHALRVTVKWLLRLSGTVFIFCSSASPAVSLSYLACLGVLYILYSLQKAAVKKIFKK